MIGLLSQEEIEAVLRRQQVGRIACTANDRPYIVPINYVYDGSSIYAYSSIGRKIGIMREQPLVCFEVDEIDGPSCWRSVVVEGRYEELTDERERDRGLKVLAGSGVAPVLRAIADGCSPQVILFRITLDHRSGRFEQRDA